MSNSMFYFYQTFSKEKIVTEGDLNNSHSCKGYVDTNTFSFLQGFVWIECALHIDFPMSP